MNVQQLIECAIEARKHAYTPYSGFAVGAALLCADGQIITGCNIESASYTPTICAERTAFAKAVSEGISQFEAITIIGGKAGSQTIMAYPCGVCRQVMMEFCQASSFKIIVAISKEEYKEYTLEQLLPHGFGPDDLL